MLEAVGRNLTPCAQPYTGRCNEDALEKSSGVRYLTSLVLNLAAQAAGKALVLQRVYANGHTFGQVAAVPRKVACACADMGLRLSRRGQLQVFVYRIP